MSLAGKACDFLKFRFVMFFDIGSEKLSATFSFIALVSLNYVSDYGSFLYLERRKQRQAPMHSHEWR